MKDWNGFKLLEDKLDGRDVIVVLPEQPNGKWILKTEYFGAFPNAEIELVRLGYHLAHIASSTRWHNWSDTDARASLAEYMHEKFGVKKECSIVGMSCGGMQGIYFASKYPELVSSLYLDAPVVNLLSCPCAIGMAENSLYEDFFKYKQVTVSELLSFRDHPLDHLDKLTENKIPVLLVCGDSDKTVPYEENGLLIKKAYEEKGLDITVIVKENCDHHPHGLDDNTPIIEFIEKHS